MKLADANGAIVCHADWRALAAEAPECDALIVDAPYSARTHAGHDDAVDQARLAGEEKRKRIDKRTGSSYSVGINRRRRLQYACFTAGDVLAFVEEWSARTHGWFVSITDHILAPLWTAALEAQGRYVFAPIAYVAPGSRVRLLGDGPSNWTTWIIVARPRTRVMAKWGTLSGAYVLPAGQGGALPVIGGKPLWLMQRLVEDYSRKGDLVVDPCCGAGTTAIAAALSGRLSIVGDVDETHAKLAARWIENPTLPAPGLQRATQTRQLSLIGGGVMAMAGSSRVAA